MDLTADAIKKVARRHFALKGYEATSLDAIAKEIGIKKQSLYTHIQSKSELFSTVFKESVDSELAFVSQYFANLAEDASLQDQLYRFIAQYKTRYSRELNLRLILYLGFLVPEQQGDEIQKTVMQYFQFTQDKILSALKISSLKLRVSHEKFAIAFMNLLEGMLVELIYSGPDSFDLRLEASWDVFWHGVSRE
ncbi:TetR/AcrR family transcriptional regulator [Paenibacillus macerans]|uniref:TetR/AcrR family transcriptional regulator n=1 Tax=Paenibacillus macerans TaxID=44252 RepID=UPI00068D9604|nr:TetR/AcrR family transcriptional regulator [Paenibacillus macerans]MCY7558514.1 TetR/AcrR family transcriptional regulator [Paenibacillus macerans]MEC0153979.1 TetR/AcrR family transcriptional regulator [Paenibacillus macerans]